METPSKEKIIVTSAIGALSAGATAVLTILYKKQLETFYYMWNTPYVDLKEDDLSKMDGQYVKVKGELNAMQLLKTPMTGQGVIGYKYEKNQKYSVLAKTITKKIKGSKKIKSSWFSSDDKASEQKGTVSTGSTSDKWKVEWETVEDIVEYAPNIYLQELAPPQFSYQPEAPQLYPIQLPIEAIEKAKYLEQKVLYNQFTPEAQRYADVGSTKRLMGSQTIESAVQPGEKVIIFGQVHVTPDGHVSIGPSRDSFSFAKRISRMGNNYRFFNIGLREKTNKIKKPYIVSQKSEDDILENEYKKSFFFKIAAIGTGILAVGSLTYLGYLLKQTFKEETREAFHSKRITMYFDQIKKHKESINTSRERFHK